MEDYMESSFLKTEAKDKETAREWAAMAAKHIVHVGEFHLMSSIRNATISSNISGVSAATKRRSQYEAVATALENLYDMTELW